MEYSFGILPDGTETFRSANGLKGEHVIVEEYEDSKITHRFKIAGILKQSEKNCSYIISNHTTVIDKSEAIKKQLTEQADALCELAEIIGGAN